MGWDNAWYNIREKPEFFFYCSHMVGSAEWARVRGVVDAYMGRKPRVGEKIGNTEVYALPLELASCGYCLFHGVTDRPGVITLLELRKGR